MVQINQYLSIPDDEIHFTAARSSGPGGQHVNKVNSRVTLSFKLNETASLDEEEKQRVKSRLGRRISQAGILRVVCQRHRSQHLNRKEALGRFVELLSEALIRKLPRIPTAATRTSAKRRLREKRHRAKVKKVRSRVGAEDE